MNSLEQNSLDENKAVLVYGSSSNLTSVRAALNFSPHELMTNQRRNSFSYPDGGIKREYTSIKI